MGVTLAGIETHAPFHHPDTIDFLETVANTYKVDNIVCIGDLIDGHANSRYDHDPDGYSAGEEVDKTRSFVEDITELFPKALYCKGNHCDRIAKAAYRAGIPSSAIRTIEEIYGISDDWDVGEYFTLDGVVYEHGDRFGSGQGVMLKAATSNMRSTVVGHIHTAFGVQFIANREKLIFGATTGALIDSDSYAMRYGKAYSKKSILGSLIIKDGEIVIPIPMLLDSKGKWLRRI